MANGNEDVDVRQLATLAAGLRACADGILEYLKSQEGVQVADAGETAQRVEDEANEAIVAANQAGSRHSAGGGDPQEIRDAQQRVAEARQKIDSIAGKFGLRVTTLEGHAQRVARALQIDENTGESLRLAALHRLVAGDGSRGGVNHRLDDHDQHVERVRGALGLDDEGNATRLDDFERAQQETADVVGELRSVVHGRAPSAPGADDGTLGLDDRLTAIEEIPAVAAREFGELEQRVTDAENLAKDHNTRLERYGTRLTGYDTQFAEMDQRMQRGGFNSRAAAIALVVAFVLIWLVAGSAWGATYGIFVAVAASFLAAFLTGILFPAAGSRRQVRSRVRIDDQGQPPLDPHVATPPPARQRVRPQPAPRAARATAPIR